MLISGNYHGAFIRDDPKLAQIITLVSNSDIIDIPDSICLAPDQNHALFEIVLRGIGDSKIIAHDGKNYFNSTTSIISDQKKDYNIFLVLPEKTSTSDVMGTVFLIDGFFNPVYPDEDVFVSFATENIDVPKQLKIPAGNSYASFPVNIKGDSWITAYTDKSTSDTLRIDFNMAKKEVHIGIAAADAIAPYSFTYLFVWLTENGMPLEPTLPIKTTLHVSDVNVIGIDGFSRDSSETVYLHNGFFMKKLATNNVGEASVTVSVPGYGTASKTVTVGTIHDIEESIIEQYLLEGCDVDLIGAGYAGRDLYNPSEWSEDITALEVEATPGKHISQIITNWEKCFKMGYSVWFMVFNEKDMQLVQKGLSGAGIDKKNYALQILDKDALDDSVNSTLGALTEVQSVIYEILISAGGQTTQNTIIEKAYKYEQKDVINTLIDLHSKKRLVKIGNLNANLQNPGAKIMWSLPKGESQDKPTENNSTQIESVDIVKDSDKETIQDNVLETVDEKLEQTDPEIIRVVHKKDTLENNKLSKDSLDSLTEFMLLSIWESHIDNNDHESAKRISDEINSRGFVIRQRNGEHHISKKPTKKKI